MLLSKIHIAGLAVVAAGVSLQFIAYGAPESAMLGDAGLLAVVTGLVIEMVAYAIDDIPGR